MRRLTMAALAALVTATAAPACRPQPPGGNTGPGASAARESERAAALNAVADLEAAIADARVAVEAASPAAATDEQRLRVSDSRRAVVGANVALQKARAALGRDDDAGARQATLGVAAHLREVVAKMKR